MRKLRFTRVPFSLEVVFPWLGRLFAALLFVFWGGFFFEHLCEWFPQPATGFPPTWVWIGQGFHLAMVVGLGLMLRWRRAGSLLTIAGSAGFALTVGEWAVLRLVLVNVVPLICFALGRPRTSSLDPASSR